MSAINRTDWLIARFDTPWRPVREAELNMSRYSPILLEAIRDARDDDVAGFKVVSLTRNEFCRLGGMLPPPKTGTIVGWQPAAILKLDSDFVSNEASLLWMHPDIVGLRYSASALAEFVPMDRKAIPEFVSARELLIMADEKQSPSRLKFTTGRHIRKRARRPMGRR